VVLWIDNRPGPCSLLFGQEYHNSLWASHFGSHRASASRLFNAGMYPWLQIQFLFFYFQQCILGEVIASSLQTFYTTIFIIIITIASMFLYFAFLLALLAIVISSWLLLWQWGLGNGDQPAQERAPIQHRSAKEVLELHSLSRSISIIVYLGIIQNFKLWLFSYFTKF